MELQFQSALQRESRRERTEEARQKKMGKLKIEWVISQRVCSSLDDQVKELKNQAGDVNREMFQLKNRVSYSEGKMSGHLSFTAKDLDLNEKGWKSRWQARRR